MSDNYRTETIQVAAVATAMVEDRDGESTSSQFGITEAVLDEVLDERRRHDEKWGDRHHTPFEWLMILMEEVGELAEEVPEPDNHTENYLWWAVARMGRMAKAWLAKNNMG